MDRPKGWVIFEANGRMTHALDLAQMKIIVVQANDTTGGTDIRVSDGPNSYWVNVKNDPATVVAAISTARSELPPTFWVNQPIQPTAPPPPTDIMPRR